MTDWGQQGDIWGIWIEGGGPLDCIYSFVEMKYVLCTMNESILMNDLLFIINNACLIMHNDEIDKINTQSIAHNDIYH